MLLRRMLGQQSGIPLQLLLRSLKVGCINAVEMHSGESPEVTNQGLTLAYAAYNDGVDVPWKCKMKLGKRHEL